MKVDSIWSFTHRGFRHLAEYHPLKLKLSHPALNMASLLWRRNIVHRNWAVYRFTGALGLPKGKDVRKSGFATFLLYNISEAEPNAVSTAVSVATCPSLSPLPIHPSKGFNKHFPLKKFSLQIPLSSIGSPWRNSFARFPLSGVRFQSTKSNSQEGDSPSCTNKDCMSPETQKAKSLVVKENSTITITTPSSGTITLPATSDRISQRLKRHHAKEELLARSSNVLGRMWIRLKWIFFRQVRPITLDDISAIFSWFLVGNIIWILLGTTTFFSLVLFTMNTVFAQEYIGQIIGNLITKETGLTVVFENAIVPHWNDGVISFNKVFVSRRPGRGNHRVQKGSQAAAVADAAMASNKEEFAEKSELEQIADSGNYTQFDLTIDTISVTLSLSKWMNGAGIVKDVEVKGMRGVVDRRHVRWKKDDDPTNYKNVHQPGDFEIENFKMEDCLVTLYQPNGFRPFRVSIFNCELPRLRKHWLFYDLLSANNMSGTFDNSLFTIHPRQLENVSNHSFDGNKKSPWKKVNRLRVDGVNIDHLNAGVTGPLGWIESGNVDMMADVMLPDDEENLNLVQVVREIKDSWKTSASALSLSKSSHDEPESDGDDEISYFRTPRAKTLSSQRDPRNLSPNKYVVLDFRVQLNNSRAAVPLFTPDLTYVNNALIRPIVAYINSRETYIPINCQVVKNFEDFEGSWTLYDSRLMDDLSAGVYDAFAVNIMDDEARALRMRKVGFWSLQLAAQLLLLSLGAIA